MMRRGSRECRIIGAGLIAMMRTRISAVARAVLPALVAIAVQAAAILLCAAGLPPLPGIGPDDPRHPVDSATMPWSAIGRVQTELGGRCTGFLIAPDVVETAAHCLYLPRTGHHLQPSSVHFLAGYALGHYRAHGRVLRFLIPPQYRPGDEADTAVFDHATLFLDQAVATPEQTLAPTDAPPSAGLPVMLAGYEQDYRERLEADTVCHVTGLVPTRHRSAMVAHDCAGTRGSSGAPLLAREQGRWVVIGVQSLAQSGRGGMATPLSP